MSLNLKIGLSFFGPRPKKEELGETRERNRGNVYSTSSCSTRSGEQKSEAEQERMEAVALCGISPYVSSPASSNRKPHGTLIHRRDKHQQLAAFRPTSHLFSYSLISPRLSPLARRKKTHVFLPHLVASMERVEETYIMVKPDGVQRGLVGEIISRFENKGFKLIGLKMFQCPQDLAEEHYKDLKTKSFFPSLIEYITSGPVICMAWEGVGVVASARKLIGSTDPLQAEPGTIRGDLAVQTGRNVVHGSDSPDNGKREIGLWFKEGEIEESLSETYVIPWRSVLENVSDELSVIAPSLTLLRSELMDSPEIALDWLLSCITLSTISSGEDTVFLEPCLSFKIVASAIEHS
ncbi:hypothetical protein V2J09_006872 [Rumex salicifolius]